MPSVKVTASALAFVALAALLVSIGGCGNNGASEGGAGTPQPGVTPPGTARGGQSPATQGNFQRPSIGKD